MSRTWSGAVTIAAHNWRRASNDRRAPLVLLVLPVMIMVVVGTVFGIDDRDPVGIVDGDGGPRSTELRAYMEAGNLRVRTYANESDMRAALRRAQVLAGVVVPAGYSRAIDAGRAVELRAVSQPGRNESAVLRAEIGKAVNRQSLAVLVERATGTRSSTARPASVSTRYGRAPTDASPFSYTAPANIVLFVVITSLVFGSGFVASRQLGTVRRMLATPTPVRAIVLGQSLSAFTVALTQAVGLFLIGALFFRVRWGDPLACALLLFVLALVGAALYLIMGTVARTPEQAVAVGVPLGIAMGMLGGCMWPLEAVSPGMQAVGHLTPNAWAMDAWIKLVFARSGLAGIGRELLALAGFVVVLFPLATWRLRRVVLATR